MVKILALDSQPGVWVQPSRDAVAPGCCELCTHRFQMLTAWKKSQRLALSAAWGLQDPGSNPDSDAQYWPGDPW